LRAGLIAGSLEQMEHPQLLASIAALIALAVAHLRWIVWTQWRCRKCSTPHIECECKPAWLKILL
jgi:hypothetical protein